MYSIEISDVSHHFSRGELVLDRVSLQVKEGSIFGFLGPNGAGKTTTLRLLLGLLRRQSGSIKVFGQSLDQHRTAILQQLGSLIESPSLYSQLTAKENLLVWQKIYQCPKANMDAVLELVGLQDTGKKKAGQFSLGMKQRLAIAVSLLHDPSLLILDEPTNGLDPGGIVEMRELLRKLNQERGITILISSHLLGEIEKLVSDVGIISKGKIMFQGSLDTLIERQHAASSILFQVSSPDRALHTIAPQLRGTVLEAGMVKVPAIPLETIALLNRQLVEAGIDVYGISRTENDLETIFMNLTHH